MTKHPDERNALLFSAFLSLENAQECENFMCDLCTKTELREMAKRLWAAKLILEGKKYSEIVKETGLSTATITRVNSYLRDGSEGYMTVLSRILKRTEESK